MPRTNHLEFYDVRRRTGFLRNIIIKKLYNRRIPASIVVFNYNDEEKIRMMLDHISTLFPDITSLFYVINDSLNDMITSHEIKLYKGKPYMTEKMENLIFRVGPCFFLSDQLTNRHMSFIK